MPFLLDLTPPEENLLKEIVKYLFENFSRLDNLLESYVINYTQITTATYEITEDELVPGTNIFGIWHPDHSVVITLPAEPTPDSVIVIKDESKNASTYNIELITPSSS